MTDTNAPSPCPHLESCPWCGCALYVVWRRANPRASCKTEGCFGRKMTVVNLDDPSDVAAWNRRAPAPTDAEIDALLRHFYESDEAAEMAKHDDRLTARAIEQAHGIKATNQESNK